MRHNRADWDSIQDVGGETSILPDEPVFIVRSKDIHSDRTARFWAKQVLDDPLGDHETALSVLRWADQMQEYRETKLGGGRAPNAPHEVLRA